MITSLANVGGETLRKRIVAEYSVVSVTIAYRTLTSLFLALSLIYFAHIGQPVHVVQNPNGGFLSLSFLRASPLVVFLVLVIVMAALLCWSQWLHLRSYQLSPISSTYPLISLTPIFLVPASFFFFGQTPTLVQFLGIVLLVGGTFGIHSNLLSAGWLAPLKAVFTDRGSRYMLGVAVIFTLTNPIEKQLVGMSGPWLEAFAYALAMVIMFIFLNYALKQDMGAVISVYRRAPVLIFCLALFDAGALVTQYMAQALLPVYVTVSIKRAGIVAIVLLGWLVFKEKGVGRKTLGCGVMLLGLIVLNVPMSLMEALLLSLLGLGVLVPLTIYIGNRGRRLAAAQAAAQGAES
jgi:drug/metabolite transporter (DMT)-like permease